MLCHNVAWFTFVFKSLVCYVHLFQGVERFSSYSGYGKNFEFKGDFKDQSQVEYAPQTKTPLHYQPIVFTTIQPQTLLELISINSTD